METAGQWSKQYGSRNGGAIKDKETSQTNTKPVDTDRRRVPVEVGGVGGRDGVKVPLLLDSGLQISKVASSSRMDG